MNTILFLKEYLKDIGFSENEYIIKENQDTLGYLISVEISTQHPKIGILLGKRKRNLTILKQILRVVGFNERINPFLIIKLV